jgi:hypothetical protein
MSPVNRIASLCILVAASSWLSNPAFAVPRLRTVVSPPYQVGNGAGVRMGHTVIASTLYNRLTAGGSFSASCISSLMSPATGQRTLSDENFVGGVSLVVTIPEWVPTLVNMPGFYSLTRGTTVSCTYNWTSRAVESGFSVGANGVSFQTGNGEVSEGFFQPFTMSVPGDTSTDEWQGCIP